MEWQILNSKDYGVPQNRERVFLVGRFGTGSSRKIFPITGTNGENPCKLQEMTKGVADAYRVYNVAGLGRTLKGEAGGLGAKTGLYMTGFDLTTNNPKQTEIARCLQARYNKGYSTRAAECTGVMVAPVLTPERKEKRQNGRRMKQAGEPMFTLTAQDRHGVAIMQRNIRIRKLTPRECWRLQGFPDEYFDRAKAAGVSDSQLYKQAGNAVTVNVAYAIAKKINEVEINE